MRHSVGEFVEGLPCNVIGHHWVEIPQWFQRGKVNDGHRMRFKCSRCSMRGGSN